MYNQVCINSASYMYLTNLYQTSLKSSKDYWTFGQTICSDSSKIDQISLITSSRTAYVIGRLKFCLTVLT